MPDSKWINGFLVGTMGIAIAGAAVAQDPEQKAKAGAQSKQAQQGQQQGAEKPKIDGTVFHAQVLLDRAGFSPGVIDGESGISFEAAVKGFQEARGLQVTGQLDQATRQALLQDKAPSTRRLRIHESDAQGQFVGSIPKDPAEQAKMQRLGYRNLLEKIAEKFHTTPQTIISLNDPKQTLQAGTVLVLPNVLPSSRSYQGVEGEHAQLLSDLNVSGQQPQASRVVVDKSDKVVRVYGQNNRLVAQFPATMGSEKDPLPLGQWKVNTVAFNPPFKYQPKLFWDVEDTEQEQMLPPGPNGPVGVVWIDLNKEHIGIHGTNSPETIKRAESHGCVRLTNWDAGRLTQMIDNGMQVIFQA
ncbi:MAG TPA: L,D-transpeptidase family protein [Allosphingosinicella sp.]|uniref:L,D-transpeptidase family protein n=1 Tax=Allosphingosinicella sp. TaxID=2823234 RepID=UPI002ED850C1